MSRTAHSPSDRDADQASDQTPGAACALVGDIGGTNARFALVDEDDATLTPTRARSMRVADFGSLADAARAYLDEALGPATSVARPKRAAIAVATAITGDHVQFTNSPWSFSTETLRRELGLDRLQLLNDFTALAWSLLTLPADQLRQVGGGSALADQPRALIGPGTGLGVSGLLAAPGGGWVALQSEGGHTSLSPADAREAAILIEAWREWPHVSFERLVCGTGLPLLCRAVAKVDTLSLPEAPDKTITPEWISTRALQGDPLGVATMSTFCAMLGTAAANLALTIGARGGVYLGGGIVPRLGDWFDRSPFRSRFESKGRFSDWLRAVPTFVIDPRDNDPALAGAAQTLRKG